MVARNPHIAKLQSQYLFQEIQRRKQELLAREPGARLINLGIGDTTQPLPEVAVQGIVDTAQQLGTLQGYSGYGDAFGNRALREQISSKIYRHMVDPNDIFISDGAKCDFGRLQLLFGEGSKVAVQDPAYPVYVATSVMTGKHIEYLSCRPENDFLPDLSDRLTVDVMCICSPNNPTGAVLTHQQLQTLVDVAREKKSIIIFDSAYAAFIRDPDLPRTIYEVEGAEEVAIEIGSFSKLSGFTGVRLGWSIVPKQLRFQDGSSVQQDWIKIITTFFNSASNLAQAGGMAALSDEGLVESKRLCDHYLENAQILSETLESVGISCYGAKNAPYLWMHTPEVSSWELFDRLLADAHIVTTPGVGFGPAGEGFLRLSAFASRDQILKAASRLAEHLAGQMRSSLACR